MRDNLPLIDEDEPLSSPLVGVFNGLLIVLAAAAAAGGVWWFFG